MPRMPTDSSTVSQSSLPGTIPLPPRLRLVQAASCDNWSQASEEGLTQTAREQLLRGKQLLLQLKELSLGASSDRLAPTLAMLSLAMHCMMQTSHSATQLEEIRLVLDRVTHELNELSQQHRQMKRIRERHDGLALWMDKAIQLSQWSLDPVRELARELHQEYGHHAPAPHWYEGNPQDPPLWAAAHGLNTAQVMLRMLSRGNTTSTDLVNAILASLVHDVGMANLPAKVLSAQEAVNPTTKQQWRQHPRWGADHIRAFLHSDEFEVAAAIAQHHERLDGSGYPLQLARTQLGELSRQLAAADAYAALCQPRPHRPAHSPRAALQLLLKEVQAGRLDENAVWRLLPWGLAPVGSIVELSDGTWAEVIAWGNGNGYGLDARPMLIRYPQRDRGTVVDLEQARQRHIVRVLTPQEIQEVRALAS